MNKLSRQEQQTHVTSLTDLGYGQSDWEPVELRRKRFYPVLQHLRALVPEVSLVVGDRGAGKSAIFRALAEDSLLNDLEASFGDSLRIPRKVEWISAYPCGTNFPDQRGQKTAFKDIRDGIEVWNAYLFRSLQKYLKDTDKFEYFSSKHAAEPSQVLSAFSQLGNQPTVCLDQLDQRLVDEDRWLYIGYDELDGLGGFDWSTMAKAVESLIGFWASYSRRWRRIRPKIFVRSDLFRRHANIGGADIAKLAASRVEILWSNTDLLAMLICRIANTNPTLYDFCESSGIKFDTWGADNDKVKPHVDESKDAIPLINKLVGQYMGESAKKGVSYRWILDHVGDAHKRVSPRNLVRLIECAAEMEINARREVTNNIVLAPSSLRRGLEKVSTDFVKQAESSEWPWFNGIKNRTKKNSLVPWSRKEIEKLLANDWVGIWGSASAKKIRPPTANNRELVDYLIELGIFRQRPNDRIDVPDIYLFGLNLSRKGGVKRGG
jgi:hypothetical protein